MSTSYPFLHIARTHTLDYGQVLLAADFFEHAALYRRRSTAECEAYVALHMHPAIEEIERLVCHKLGRPTTKRGEDT